MVGLMQTSTMEIIKKWESRILEISQDSGDLDMRIDEDLKTLSGDIISRACFGSSYSRGNLVFEKIALMQEALSKPSLLFGFLNFRYVLWAFQISVFDFLLASSLASYVCLVWGYSCQNVFFLINGVRGLFHNHLTVYSPNLQVSSL